MDNNTVFDDIMQGLHEIEEHQKGNIQLKSTIVEVPDDEVEFYGKYQKLPETAKKAIHVILDEMLHVQPYR